MDKELRRFQSVAAGGFPDSWALLEPAELFLTHRQTSFNVAQLHTGNIKTTNLTHKQYITFIYTQTALTQTHDLSSGRYC